MTKLEDAIARLAGVRRARVETMSNEITSVRVLVIPERNHSETIRSVQETVLKETGQPLELDRIEVMSSGAQHEQTSSGRRKLLALRTTREQDRFSAQVALEFSGDVLVGEGEGPAGRYFEARSVARATLDALRLLMTFGAELDSADVLNVGDERVATVIVMNQQSSERLVGSALVKMDENDAIVRATLRAVDRVLSTPSRGTHRKANGEA